MPGQHPVPEPGREPLHLRFDRLGHVDRGTERNMAVGPRGVPPGRGTGGIRDTSLHEQYERAGRMPAAGHRPFSRGDLGQGAPEVHGRGAGHGRVPPRHRTVQRPVDLEHTRPVPVAGQRAPVAGRQPVAGDREHLAWSQVEQHHCRRRQLGEGSHRAVGDQLPTEPAQPCDQGVRKRLRPAHGQWPADSMRQHREEKPIPAGDGLAQVEHGMGGEAGEQRAATIAPQRQPGEHRRRPQPAGPEPGQRDRGRRGQIERGEQAGGEAIRVGGERGEQSAPPRPRPEIGVRLHDIAVQQRRRRVLKRVREWHRRMCPTQALRRQWQRTQRRRGQRQRQHSGAHIVSEPRQGQLLGAQPAAGGRRGFDDEHPPAGFGERDRAREPVGTGADDDRVEPVRTRCHVGRVSPGAGPIESRRAVQLAVPTGPAIEASPGRSGQSRASHGRRSGNDHGRTA